jgi:hypothetical protein
MTDFFLLHKQFLTHFERRFDVFISDILLMYTTARQVARLLVTQPLTWKLWAKAKDFGPD